MTTTDNSERQPSLLASPTVRKRRRRRLGSVRELASGRFEVRARIVLPTGEAHTVRRTCDANHLEEVRAAVLTEAREYRDGLARPNTNITLLDYQPRFARSRAWTAERKSSWKVLKPLWPLALHAISLEPVSAWATRLRKKHSAGYVRHAFELLRMLLLHAHQAGVLTRIACPSKVPGIASHKHAFNRRRPMESSEVEALMRAADAFDAKSKDNVALRLRTLLYTGARPVEVARAERAWLRDARGPGYANVPAGSGLLDLPPCKGGDARSVPLPPTLYRALLTHFMQLPPAAQRSGFLFPVLRGKRWCQRSQLITDVQWQRVRDAAGLAGIVLYQLKHTRLTQVTNDPRLGARAAQSLAGHTDVRTTLVYAAKSHITNSAAFEEMPGAAQVQIFQPALCPDCGHDFAGPRCPRCNPEPPPQKTGRAAAHKNRPPSKSGKRTPEKSRATSRASAAPQERVSLFPETEHAPEKKSPPPTPNLPAELPSVLVALSQARVDGIAVTLDRLNQALGPLDSVACCRELLDVVVSAGLPSTDVQLATALLHASRRRAMPVANKSRASLEISRAKAAKPGGQLLVAQ